MNAYDPVFRDRTHALFQARMWRDFAQVWDGGRPGLGLDRGWVEHVLQVPRAECLRRARVALAACRSLPTCPWPEEFA